MPFVMGGMLVVGAAAGAMKSGGDREISQMERDAMAASSASMAGFGKLIAKGPGEADYMRGVQSQRDLAQLLQGYSTSGLYDFAKGNEISQQAFAGQRKALQLAFEDQINAANKSAAIAGRSGNDPILRARLAQEQMRQSSLLDANQSAAAVDFGRQYSLDRIGNQQAATNMFSSVGNQALNNQLTMFNMAQGALGSERNFSLANAQYEESRGGGLKGAITGGLAGLGAGMNMATGLSAIRRNDAATDAMKSGGMGGFNFGQASPAAAFAMSGMDSSVGRSSAPRSAPSPFSFSDEGYGGDLSSNDVNYGPNYGPQPLARPGWANGAQNPYRAAAYDLFHGGQGNIFAPLGGNAFSYK